jgi:UDP-N-acetylglucosamine 2-epimerase
VVMEQAKDGPPRIIADYDVDNVSKKIVRIILGYTDFVNRRVWNKA